MIIFAGAASAYAGNLQQQLTAESVIAEVLKRGSLQVGMSTFKPWAMKDKTGNLIGFEIDVAKRLAGGFVPGVAISRVSSEGVAEVILTKGMDGDDLIRTLRQSGHPKISAMPMICGATSFASWH